MHHLLTRAIDTLFPPLCVHCRREGAWLCLEALMSLADEPVLLNDPDIAGVDRVVCRGSYDHPVLGRLVTSVKYSFWAAAAEAVTSVLAPLAAHVPREAVIIPVPLHGRRRRERGFNQSEYVARSLSILTGLPVAPLLRRVRYTTPQAKLDGHRRQTNIMDAFSVAPRLEKIPTSGILVDDVITTGSTIRECTTVLRQNGMTNIIAIALAKG